VQYRGPYPPRTEPAKWREFEALVVHEGYMTGPSKYPVIRCGIGCRWMLVPVETPTTCIECLAAACG